MSSNPLTDYSARTKSVYIELPNYEFYHGPSNIKNNDKRIIGREHLINRLINILTNSASRTGAYLVTGYRGSGKSSLVNHVISEITHFKSASIILRRYIFLMTITLLSSFITINLFFEYDYLNKLFSHRVAFLCFTSFIITIFALIINRIGNNYVLNKASTRLLKYLELAYRKQTYYIFGRLYRFKRLDNSAVYNMVIRIFSLLLFMLSILIKFINTSYQLLIDPLRLERSKKQSQQHTNILKSIYFIFVVHFLSILRLLRNTDSDKIKFLSIYLSSFLLISFVSCVFPLLVNKIKKLYYQGISNLFYKFVRRLRWIVFIYRYKKSKNDKIDIKTFLSAINFILYRSLLIKLINIYNLLIRLNVILIFNLIVRATISPLVRFFKDILIVLYNKKRIIPIHINMSYSNLDEKDILQLIVIYIRSAFKTRKHKAVGWYYPGVIFIFILVLVSQEFSIIKNSRKEINSLYNTRGIFPSQSSEYKTKQEELVLRYKTYLSHNNYSYRGLMDYIYGANYFNQYDSSNSKPVITRFIHPVRNTISYLDLFITARFVEIKKVVFHIITGERYTDISVNNRNNQIAIQLYNYFSLNYYPFINTVFILLLFNIIRKKMNLFGLGTNYKIEKKLDELHESIQSTREFSINSESTFTKLGITNKINRGHKRRYEVSQARDIEKALINILNMMEDVPVYMYNLEFVIIFDEIDKLGERNNEDEIENQSKPGTSENDRKKLQQEIFHNFIKSMKYFLTSAPVKFIVIAGREMYDSYLGDVSDRELNLRNVFNDVIYVNSFLSPSKDFDSTRNQDITLLTENYICQFLIPSEYMADREPTIKLFNQFIRSRHSEFLSPYNTFKGIDMRKFESDLKIYKQEDLLQRQKDEKLIILLYQFVIFLLHMSNGIPKKISSLFEKYIIKGNKNAFNLKDDFIAGKNPESFYLCFNSEQQYEIGLTASLMAPVFYAISNYLKNYNDKLLFSTTFLINHIFKYHTHQFSIQSFESSHELISTNRNPEVRNYIKKVIHYLVQTHLYETSENIHYYKFSKRVSFEMSYVSRISEMASSAFNFIPFESVETKKYYINKIALTRKDFTNNSRYLSATIRNYNSLGDICFYEDNLDESIRFYSIAINLIKEDLSNNDLNKIELLLKLLLRTGLCYEKTKNFEEALSLYSEALEYVLKHRDLPLRELDLSLASYNNQKCLVKGYNKNYDGESVFINYKNSRGERDRVDFSKIQSKLLDHLTTKKANYLQKLNFFENSRICYQPILAKLMVIEKESPNGITKKDIDQATIEFDYLLRPINISEKYMIVASFKKELADILFYKNVDINYKHNKDRFGYKAIELYLESLKYHLCNFMDTDSIIKDSQGYFMKPSDLNATKPYLGNFLILSIICFKEKLQLNHRSNIFQSIAELLSSIGDCCLQDISIDSNLNTSSFDTLNLLSDYFSKVHIGEIYITDIIQDLSENSCYFSEKYLPKIKKSQKNIKASNNVMFSTLFYLASSNYFLRAKKYKQSAFQIQKLFFTIHDKIYYDNNLYSEFSSIILSTGVRELRNRLKESLKVKGFLHQLYQNALRSSYGSYDYVHNIQLEKYKEMLSESMYLNDDIRDCISLKKLTLDFDIEPLTFFYEKLKIFTLNREDNILEDVFLKNLVSPYLLENSMFNKAIRLRFKSYLNYEHFKIFKLTDYFIHFKSLNLNLYLETFQELIINSIHKKSHSFSKIEYCCSKNFNALDLFEFFISDSIYCLSEIIDIYNTFGQDNIFNHSFIAHVHEEILYWLITYRHYIFILEILGMYEDMGDFSLLEIREPWIRFLHPLVKLQSEIFGDSITKDEISSQFKNIIRTIHNSNRGKGGIDFKKRAKSMKINIQQSLKRDSLNCLDPIYHGEQAILHYYSAIDMHCEGKAYNQLIEKLYYINDDFSDMLFHYRLAQERNRVSNGWLHKRKDEVNRFMKYTELYHQSHYTTTKLF